MESSTGIWLGESRVQNGLQTLKRDIFSKELPPKLDPYDRRLGPEKRIAPSTFTFSPPALEARQAEPLQALLRCRWSSVAIRFILGGLYQEPTPKRPVRSKDEPLITIRRRERIRERSGFVGRLLGNASCRRRTWVFADRA